jgi:hypothetical protein
LFFASIFFFVLISAIYGILSCKTDRCSEFEVRCRYTDSGKECAERTFQLHNIKNLEIQFIDEIEIPEEMGMMSIDKFKMSGRISSSGIDRICRLFPKTELIINEKKYNIRLVFQ